MRLAISRRHTTVGVQRQYTGTAGRIENAQVAVYLVYATSSGHAIIDRDLYLPGPGPTILPACKLPGVPGQVGFATKSVLATRMLARALAADVPAAWVTSDEVYGANPGLRAELETRGIGYVLAVACDHHVGLGRRHPVGFRNPNVMPPPGSTHESSRRDGPAVGREWRPGQQRD